MRHGIGNGLISAVASILTAMHLFSFISAAHAATLERLSDGRIVLTVLGERIAFREKDARWVDLYWPPSACNRSPQSGPTLESWLNDPQVADCLNRSIPDRPEQGKSVTLRIQLTLEDGRPIGLSPPVGAGRYKPSDGGLYPGRIEPRELPEAPSLDDLFITVSHFKAGLPNDHQPAVEGLSDGYQVRHAGKSPPFDEYTLPPERRLGAASRPLRIVCSQIVVWSCTITSRSSDKIASLSLGWSNKNVRGPLPSWRNYDAIARKIAASIFIDRTPEDLQ